MTESEAIEWIKELRDSEEIREFYYVENFIKACDMAIQALYMLNGWQNSRGACIEKEYADRYGIPEVKFRQEEAE